MAAAAPSALATEADFRSALRLTARLSELMQKKQDLAELRATVEKAEASGASFPELYATHFQPALGNSALLTEVQAVKIAGAEAEIDSALLSAHLVALLRHQLAVAPFVATESRTRMQLDESGRKHPVGSPVDVEVDGPAAIAVLEAHKTTLKKLVQAINKAGFDIADARENRIRHQRYRALFCGANAPKFFDTFLKKMTYPDDSTDLVIPEEYGEPTPKRVALWEGFEANLMRNVKEVVSKIEDAFGPIVPFDDDVDGITSLHIFFVELHQLIAINKAGPIRTAAAHVTSCENFVKFPLLAGISRAVGAHVGTGPLFELFNASNLQSTALSALLAATESTLSPPVAAPAPAPAPRDPAAEKKPKERRQLPPSSWADADDDDVPISTGPVLPSGPGARVDSRGEGQASVDPASVPADARTAFVGNLPFKFEESALRNFFSPAKVTSVRIMKDKETDRPKGFCYVVFAERSGLLSALQKNGTSFGERSIKVDLASENPNRPSRPQTKSDGDSSWRSRDQPVVPMRATDGMDRAPRSQRPPGFSSSGTSTATERPRLNLQPRSVDAPLAADVTPRTTAASPFGGARPRDEAEYQRRRAEELAAKQTETQAPAPAPEARPTPADRQDRPPRSQRPVEASGPQPSDEAGRAPERYTRLGRKPDGSVADASANWRDDRVQLPAAPPKRAWAKPDGKSDKATTPSDQSAPSLADTRDFATLRKGPVETPQRGPRTTPAAPAPAAKEVAPAGAPKKAPVVAPVKKAAPVSSNAFDVLGESAD